MDEGFNLPSKYHDTVYFKLPLAIPVSLLSYHLASLHRCWKMLLDLSVDTCQHWNDCYIQIIFIICWNCPCTVSYLFLLFHVACFFWHAVPMMFFLFKAILCICWNLNRCNFFYFNISRPFFKKKILYFSNMANAKLFCLLLSTLYACVWLYENLSVGKWYFSFPLCRSENEVQIWIN